ncbi:MAG TPA: DUF87 domain-containing protein [Mycobacteriales bacterium]|nr:DUF87 domain-containing protein [Mycobacteriales bacterium]
MIRTVALELRAGPRLLSEPERARLAASLTAAVAGIRAPVRVWHGPRAGNAGRGTWLTGAALPAAGPDGDLVRLVTDGHLPGLPAVCGENRGSVRLAGGRAGRLLFLDGWPAAVGLDWLARLTADPALGALVVALLPVPPIAAERMLRRRLAALSASALLADRAGRLADPQVDRAITAAGDLRARLAAGETALIGVRVTVALVTEPGRLDDATDRTGRLLASSGPAARLRVCSYEQRPGWAALTGPERAGRGRGVRFVDAETAAMTIPLPHPAFLPFNEPLLGTDPDSGAVIGHDRFAEPNPTRLVVGASGAGKSFAAKLEVSRWLDRGAAVLVVDPEGEFGALAAHRGGLVVDGGIDPVRLAADPRLPAGEALELLATVVTALLGRPPGPRRLAELDSALTRLRSDPEGAVGLIGLLGVARAGSVDGTVAGLFRADPRLDDPPPLVVSDLRGTPARLRAAVTACALAWAWTGAAAPGPGPVRARLVVIDEAHLLLGDAAAAEVLAGFARRARKYGVGLELVTQRLSDFLAGPSGQAVLANAATLLLLGAAEHERAATADGLGLSPGAARLLVAGTPGLGLLVSRRGLQPVLVTAAPGEHALAAAGPRRIGGVSC